MTKDTAMTTVIPAPMTPTALDQAEAAINPAAVALAVLEESWAYYTPEAPVVSRDIDAVDGVLAYYEAA
jgi:hypothetical protein